jgi:hypothetical protein
LSDLGVLSARASDVLAGAAGARARHCERVRRESYAPEGAPILLARRTSIRGDAYAALAFDPPLLLSPEVPAPGLLVSVDVFLASSLFVALLSPESVFAGDFVSLALGLDSVDDGFFEP